MLKPINEGFNPYKEAQEIVDLISKKFTFDQNIKKLSDKQKLDSLNFLRTIETHCNLIKDTILEK